MLFGKREVFMTNEIDQYVKAKQALIQAGMNYDLRTFSPDTQWGSERSRMKGTWSSTEQRLYYYIYVKKADEERARYLIREAFRPGRGG